MLNHTTAEKAAGADEFLPVLIYTVLKANPPHLYSNVYFIQKFRNPSKLTTEIGYYYTNLQSVVSFIDTLDASSLTIDPAEFAEKFAGTARADEPDAPENGGTPAVPAEGG
eukprot:CAMPEP_0177667250 /NCGR_PEP_ID=MMETSP0447-20121125/22018_1 /TAXON_ID=0 /ORGANISM="Stygamoeba regulata, Strain BSH-02190019" /LENGTH=110 /DNA_ID=CAMNT_0019173459 /DNA_START=401 /DNA_END=729 /DNA_ORIENTATION=+